MTPCIKRHNAFRSLSHCCSPGQWARLESWFSKNTSKHFCGSTQWGVLGVIVGCPGLQKSMDPTPVEEVDPKTWTLKFCTEDVCLGAARRSMFQPWTVTGSVSCSRGGPRYSAATINYSSICFDAFQDVSLFSNLHSDLTLPSRGHLVLFASF